MAKKISNEDLRTCAELALKATKVTMTPELQLILKDWLNSHPIPKELPILTSRQTEIFNFIKNGIRQQHTPTVREIGAKFGILSPNGVMCHLKALERKGLITRLSHSSRGIQIDKAYMND